MSDSGVMLTGAFVSVAIAQIGNEMGVPDWITTLSAPGVLGVVFYYVMYRFEKRLDQAFNECKEQNNRLFELLEKHKESK